jgi:CRP/FNR family cyclic AMP-dependent transcriptional regulator
MSAAQRDKRAELASGRLAPARSVSRPAPYRLTPLLDLDPDLGSTLSPERFALARSTLRARVLRLPRGEWRASDLATLGQQNVGLLLLEGVIAREVVLEDTVSTELLGPQDLIRPWSGSDELDPLEPVIRWQVLADARLAVLGGWFAGALARFPEINAILLDRACAHAQRLATTQAIGHLTCVDRRVHALLWHLAGRWGRMTPDGVVVPLTLSHRLLGELVGARRPTVSTALASLEREGKVLRRSDATWLLTGEPPSSSGAAVHPLISHRRRLLRQMPG